MAEPDLRERFTALYDTYHPRVHAYAVSRAGRQLAEEVTSETFCVAWPFQSSLAGWTMQRLTNWGPREARRDPSHPEQSHRSRATSIDRRE